MDVRERYLRLERVDVDTETALAAMACEFFSPMSVHRRRKLPPGTSITPASSQEFMEHVEERGLLGAQPDRYVHQVRDLLARLCADGILVDMGAGGTNVMMPKSYYCFHEVSRARAAGMLWLARTLGGRFVHWAVSQAVVHIVGSNHAGEGSGVVFDNHHVLTCEHVVSGMDLSPTQTFQGKTVAVAKTFCRPDVDLAVIRTEEALTPVPGLTFLRPEVSQKVYRFGYSRVPCSRPTDAGESPMVMQSGEVTNESVVMFGDREVFLYSAVSRPGDSGGAVVSEDGYVVGITTELSYAQMEAKEGQEVFSPHYAGIPADVAARAVDDMGLGIRLPYETFA